LRAVEDCQALVASMFMPKRIRPAIGHGLSFRQQSFECIGCLATIPFLLPKKEQGR
jgi:hypothetical protein